MESLRRLARNSAEAGKPVVVVPLMLPLALLAGLGFAVFAWVQVLGRIPVGIYQWAHRQPRL